jgi:hypothetical protein
MNKTRIGIVIAALLVLYFGSYAILSATGGFVFTQSGKIRLGISLDDQWIWMPRYGWAQPYQWPDGRNTVRVGGIAGWLYLPLILVDQAWAHPTQRFITPDGQWVKDFVPPSTNLWHHDMLESNEDINKSQQTAAPLPSAPQPGPSEGVR